MGESCVTTPVYLVVQPGTLLLDLAGVAEPLRLANTFSRARGLVAPFDLCVVAAEGQTPTSLGVDLTRHAPLPQQFETGGRAWVIVIGVTTQPHGLPPILAGSDAVVVEWLSRVVAPAVAAGTARVFTVCSGALSAARAGLLEGRECTTHHQLLDELAALSPTARVERDRIFVLDNHVATSAGITAGIDLALAAIHQHCGPAIASQVARDLVVFWRRAGGDPQLSPLVDHRNHLHPAVHRAQDAIVAKPQQRWDATSIAQAAHASERHIRRLFVEHAGITPNHYVNRIRVALARRILENETVSVERVADRVGFGSARQLRDAWRREAEDSPKLARRPTVEG